MLEAQHLITVHCLLIKKLFQNAISRLVSYRKSSFNLVPYKLIKGRDQTLHQVTCSLNAPYRK